MFRKSLTARQKERKHARAMSGVEARHRKRMEFGATLHDVGGITTDGLFGAHSIRLLSYGDEDPHYAITVDGEHRTARTERGILRLIAEMVYRKIQRGAAVRRAKYAARAAEETEVE
jgi:hypothetical protein